MKIRMRTRDRLTTFLIAGLLGTATLMIVAALIIATSKP